MNVSVQMYINSLDSINEINMVNQDSCLILEKLLCHKEVLSSEVSHAVFLSFYIRVGLVFLSYPILPFLISL